MKQTLIKINEQHYVVVDNSEIKENQWYCNDKVLFLSDSKFDEGNNPNQNKNNKLVTHSTQPLEIIATKYKGSVAVEEMKGFDKIKPLSLSEVEELIHGYSVEKMIEERFKDDKNPQNIVWLKKNYYKEGFNALKELVKDKLFTIEDLRRAFDAGNEGSGGSLRNRVRKYNGFDEYITNELGYVWDKDNGYVEPKQTEWLITFDKQGKIKLI